MSDILVPKPFTVVLMRGHRFQDIPDWGTEPRTDTYVAHVRAHNKQSAVRLAKEEVIAADNKDLKITLGARHVRALGLNKEDYDFLVMFEGHLQPACFGWESGPWQKE